MTPSATARTLVARSRRPARPARAAPAFRLAEGTVHTPSQGGPARAATPSSPASAPVWQAPRTTAPTTMAPTTATPAVQAHAPQAAIWQADAPQAAARQAAAPEAIVLPPAAETYIPSAAPAPAGESLRYPEAVARAAGSRETGSPSAGSPPPVPSTGTTVPAAPLAPARATGSASPGPPPAPVTPAARRVDTSEPPRHDVPRIPAPQAPVADRDVQGRAGREEPVAATRATDANPLVGRARRPGRSVKRPDEDAIGSVAPRPPEPVTVEPPAPERSPARPRPPTGPQAAPTHPPVTIGEIHVHVAEPPSAAADPLALLAPYARGLTARGDGAW